MPLACNGELVRLIMKQYETVVKNIFVKDQRGTGYRHELVTACDFKCTILENCETIERNRLHTLSYIRWQHQVNYILSKNGNKKHFKH